MLFNKISFNMKQAQKTLNSTWYL